MKTLILRTIYHTNVWENDKQKCSFEKSQLENMILNWEPDYFEIGEEDVNFALGIYAPKYFLKSFWGKVPFSGSNGEQIISILKPINFEKTNKIVFNDKSEVDNPFARLSFNYVSKLYDKPDKSLMLKIDNDLCMAKVNLLKSTSGKVDTEYQYPLSFLLPSEIVFNILAKYKF